MVAEESGLAEGSAKENTQETIQENTQKELEQQQEQEQEHHQQQEQQEQQEHQSDSNNSQYRIQYPPSCILQIGSEHYPIFHRYNKGPTVQDVIFDCSGNEESVKNSLFLFENPLSVFLDEISLLFAYTVDIRCEFPQLSLTFAEVFVINSRHHSTLKK